MAGDTVSSRIYTLGHSNHSPETFLRLLRRHDIQVVVDVRSVPYSRHVPHFNKNEIEPYLAGHGLTYLFMGESIGGKPADPSLRAASGGIDYVKLAATDQFRQGIARLVKGIAGGWRIALTCAEEDPRHCHRHWLIARKLEHSANIRVIHIRADGRTLSGREIMPGRPRQMDLF